MNYSVIILSAGKGIRVGNSIPKQYLMLAGKPMLVHTLERVDLISDIKEIVIVCSKEYVDIIKNYIDKYGIRKNIVFVEGGETRQASVYNGLLAADCENVIIHEAARPFVTVSDFRKLIACPYENVSYTYGIPYTVLKKDENDLISGVLNREELINIQLPQKFVKEDLIYCHNKALENDKTFTEDASMIKYYIDKPIYCLNGSAYNIKITEYIDLLFGEVLCKEKFMEERM